ncbi:Carboxylic acid transporter [Coemansia sp. RSA 454]|nr:Carboxylic acid transporter [Coemansia sp. RSA 454]
MVSINEADSAVINPRAEDIRSVSLTSAASEADFVDEASIGSEKGPIVNEDIPVSQGQVHAARRRRTWFQTTFSHVLGLFERPDPRNKLKNPIRLLKLTPRQAFTFSVACLGWMVDSLDFFCVTMTTTELAEAFGKEPSDITSAITVTLMLRPIGALLFGIIADRYGRRIPLIVNLSLFTVIELASGFAQNLETFIGLRAIYGILMGGEWGLGNSLAMEVLPVESRGIFSGILQMSYSVGNLVAAMLYYAVVPNLNWRALYWISIIPAAITIVMSLFLKERLSYQLGNLISASASQIEATMGEKNPLPELRDGETVPNYGRVQGILIGIIFCCVLVLAVFGREEKGKRFEVKSKPVDDDDD